MSGENFLLLRSRTCCFIFYVELSSLWTVNNTFFCLFRFLYISYGQRITLYFVSCFILHQLGKINNAVFCLFCFLSPPLCCSKNQFTLCLQIGSNVMVKIDCNLKCPFFLHINDNSLQFFDVYIFYDKFENGFVDVKYLCRYYVTYVRPLFSLGNFVRKKIMKLLLK